VGVAAAQGVVEIALPDGATVADAVAACDALARAASTRRTRLRDPRADRASATPLADGDRVEITRPLVADPKAARRDRASARPLPPSSLEDAQDADGDRPTGRGRRFSTTIAAVPRVPTFGRPFRPPR
jgi:putative ubiquitin-RnfH superfamily antitoxin RatB of RatAB toxin-antitoxin module